MSMALSQELGHDVLVVEQGSSVVFSETGSRTSSLSPTTATRVRHRIGLELRRSLSQGEETTQASTATMNNTMTSNETGFLFLPSRAGGSYIAAKSISHNANSDDELEKVPTYHDAGGPPVTIPHYSSHDEQAGPSNKPEQMLQARSPGAQVPDAQATQRHMETHKKTKVVGESWDLVVPIPGLKGKSIFMYAKVESPNCSESEYINRFTFLSRLLEEAINTCRDLRDETRLRVSTSYELKMVGESRETAKPTIVVHCIMEYFRKLKSLFDKLVQNFSLPNNRWHLYKRYTKALPPAAPLALVYFCTATNSIKRKASDFPLVAGFDTDVTWCGGIIEHGSRTASLGLTVETDHFIGTLTVDHLFLRDPFSRDFNTWWFEFSQEDEDRVTYGLDKVEFQHLLDRLFGLRLEYCLEVKEDSPTVLGDGDTVQKVREELREEHGQDAENLGDLWVDSNDEYHLDEDEEAFPDGGEEADDMSGKPWALPNLYPSISESRGTEEWERIIPPLPSTIRRASYMDWAMTRPTNSGNFPSRPPRQNMFFPHGRSQQPVMLESIAKEPRCHLAGVYMVSGIRGVLPARLLGGPSMLGSGPGQELCEVWTILIDARQGLLEGECGSAVIDQITNKVYGHVVAGGPVDQAYIIPIDGVFRQIRSCFNTKEAKLFTSTSTNSSELDTVTKKMETPFATLWALDDADSVVSRSRSRSTVPSTHTALSRSTLATSYSESVLSRSGTDTRSASFLSSPRAARRNPLIPFPKPKDEATRKRDLDTYMASSRQQSTEDRQLARLNSTVPRPNVYFLPRDGVDREVITADICRYLGNDALVRPGTHQDPETGILLQGYVINAYRNLTTAMLESLKEDSARWDAERRKRTAKSTSYPGSSAPGYSGFLTNQEPRGGDFIANPRSSECILLWSRQ